MSNKYLGPADRQLIAEKWAAYASVREIAALVGVAPKTIYQELRRGNNGTLDKNSRQSYNPDRPSVVSRKASAGAESP